MKRIIYTLLGIMLSIGAWAQNVAQIGSTGYETLQAAFDAATTGQTVQLIADQTLSSVVTITAEKNFTLDLYGYTLNGKLTNNGTLTIKSSISGGKMFRSTNISNVIGNNTATASLTIESGIIELDGTPGSNGAITNKGTLLIKGGEIKSGKYPVFVASGKCEITGGTLTSTTGSIQVYLKDGGIKAPESYTNNSNVTFTSAESGYLYTAEGAVNLVSPGETITLIKDLLSTFVYNKNVNMTLNLGDNNILSSTMAIETRTGSGTLTIEGEGIVKGNVNRDSDNPAVWAHGGNIVINGGTFDVGGVDGNGNPTIYADGSSTVTINGGTFKNEATSNDKYWVLNIKDGSSANIVVNGGEFYNFDPANNVNDGNTGSGTDYLASGKITQCSESGSDKIYTVIDGQWIATITDVNIERFRFASLDDAIDAAKTVANDITITLLADATATEELPENVTIDAASHALTLPTFNVTDGSALAYANVINPTNYKVTTATYTRTLPASTQWGTVCVPFTLTQGDGTDAPKLYIFSSISDKTLTVTEAGETVAPGTPVIFCYTGSVSPVVFRTTEASVSSAAPTSGTLIGTYTGTTITSDLSNIYYINGDKFHQAKASLTVPAYRAYIQNNASGAKPSILSLFIDDDSTTATTAVEADITTAQSIYDINGRMLTAPQKGINILKLANGKTLKLIVK